MKLLAALITLSVAVACAAGGVSQQTSQAPTPAPTPTAETRSSPDTFGDLPGDVEQVPLAEDDALGRGEYRLVRREKRVKVDGGAFEHDVQHAVLEKAGKVVRTFGADSIEPDSEIRFGAFDFLGRGDTQLVVEQTANKYWRYWVVEFSPRPRVIFDGSKYDTVHPLRAADFDSDGRREIVQNLGTFWYFDMLGNPGSPRPPVVFAYSDAARTYLPSSPRFQHVTLADIEARVAKMKELKGRESAYEWRGFLVDVVVRYIYSGHEREAWAFLERECGGCRTLDDRNTLAAELKKTLSQDKLYRALSRAGH